MPKPNRSHSSESYPSVVIIGAGIAGIAAATSLRQSGIDVRVVEARSRVGGRIWTNYDLESAVELGATWIHGDMLNPISALAAKHRILTCATDWSSARVWDTSGVEFSRKVVRKAHAQSEALYHQLAETSERADRVDDIGAALAKLTERAKRRLSTHEQQALDWVLLGDIAMDIGDEPRRLSLRYMDDDDEFDGAHLAFPGGYAQIVEGLAQPLEITTDACVLDIDWSASRVVVRTSDAEYHADKVVITLPLGVLKAGSVAFYPPLPDKKAAAIESLGMGLLDTLALRFDDVFWPRDADIVGVVGKRFSWFRNLVRVTGENVLVHYAVGDDARAVAELDDAAVGAFVLKALRQAFGNSVTQPNAMLRSNWSKDPFAQGAYSHVPPGGRAKAFKTLAKPVAKRLYFAGEATSRRYRATVHGAWLSGLREARRIIRSTQ
jgi:polyamine oxidase